MSTLWQRLIASKLTVLLTGVTAGAVSAPLLGRAARPLVRGLIKAGLIVQAETLQIVTRLREEVEDLKAEAKHELDEHPVHAVHQHTHGPLPNQAQA